MALNVVLVEPEIPQNTGNIARTCAATGSKLHLVKPLGFSVEDRYLKRAGLDYWKDVRISYYDSFGELKDKYLGLPFYYMTTRASASYSEIKYPGECFLVFGKETAGLPESLLADNPEQCLRIPMKYGIRSLNLSNSVAIVVYEALRQNGFKGMRQRGSLSGSKAGS